MKSLYQILMLSGIVLILTSCEKDKKEETQIDFQISFEANGREYTLENCSAVTTQSGSVVSTRIVAGEKKTDASDSTYYFPGIMITLPENTVGTYTSEHATGLFYFVSFQHTMGNYLFPSLPLGNPEEEFEITISKYDLEKNILQGSFHGKIKSTSKDEILTISNGEIAGVLGTVEK